MNRIYRSVWSEALGAFVAAAETTRGKGPRGSARTTPVAAAGVMLLAMAAPMQARADTAIGPVKIDNTGGAVCTSPDRPTTASSTWTCQVPNGSGGFATITGVPGAASGYPDVAALSTLLSTNLGPNAILIGSKTTSASGSSSIAIGNDAAATGLRAIAMGKFANAVSPDAVAIGPQAFASGSGTTTATAIGAGARATGQGAIAISASSLTGDGTAAIYPTLASGPNSTAVGIAAATAGNAASAFGVGASAQGDSSTALGDGSRAIGAQAVAIGKGAQALGNNSISIGTGNVVSGANSAAIGDPNVVSGNGSYVLGNNNTVSADNAFVVGNNVTATHANNVVLGNASTDKAAAQVNSATVPGVIATLNADGTVSYSPGPTLVYSGFAGTASGVVSVGAAGAERQIVNVAPGAITATSTDAVNGSQLYAVASAVNTLGGNITTIVNNAQTHYYSVNDGGTQQANYNNAGASGTNSIAAGPGASASANNSVAMGANASATTDNSVALGNGSTTTTATPTASVTIQGQTYNFAGANPTGVVSVGSAGAERQIQNVAAGQLSATSTDAVNGSQLYATNQAINNIQTGGGIKYFHANSQAADSQAAGAESVAIGPQAIALGASAIATGNGAQANGAGSIALGANAIATSSNGVAIGTGSAADRAGMNGQKELFSNVSVLSTQGGVSMGSAGNERQITNVAGGTQATDAVNVRQLQAVQRSAVRYDTNVDGTVNYNSVTMGNGASTGPVTVHNVAPGVSPTDAVNVQQLNQANAANAAYADARVNQMGKAIDDIGKKAYAGVAAAMAMESAPYVPGKLTYAAGMGYYEQQAAMGVSLRKTADNGRWSVTGGASATSRGTVALRVGIGGVWD
ncbi:ESPR-type extended signal peptide-containing protein [Variovorax atrisoli]|uniref:ESPR-type extended signal peptide-containing protein n=1 Tax=Variovorax atrisoli TaxID=3394203 RepID=UPI003399F160